MENLSHSKHFSGLKDFVTHMQKFDIFKEWQIDCALHMVMIGTHPNYGNQGIALRLVQQSIELAKTMMNNNEETKPKAVKSIFSSLYTQKIGEKLKFEVLHAVPYTELRYKDQLYSDAIDKIHNKCIYMGLRL